MRDIRRGLWLMAIGILLLVGATFVHAEEVYPEKEWVWGCQIRGRTLSGDCVVRKFTKVGDADNDVDTDEEQVLGFEPGNVPVSRSGEPIWTRLKADRFLMPGHTKLVSGAKCSCGR